MRITKTFQKNNATGDFLRPCEMYLQKQETKSQKTPEQMESEKAVERTKKK